MAHEHGHPIPEAEYKKDVSSVMKMIIFLGILTVVEVIFALSPTMEGDTTNFYLFKKIQGNNLLITSLSRGVAIGSELQYADELTLGRSLEQRQEFKMPHF